MTTRVMGRAEVERGEIRIPAIRVRLATVAAVERMDSIIVVCEVVDVLFEKCDSEGGALWFGEVVVVGRGNVYVLDGLGGRGKLEVGLAMSWKAVEWSL